MSAPLRAGARVVIAGGGQAAVQAALSLREAAFTGSVTIVADEPGDPYQRPPLSKGFLQSPTATALPLRTVAALAKREVAIIHDQVTEVNRAGRAVHLASGIDLEYDHLILATGARNRSISLPGAELGNVLGLRSLHDSAALRDLLQSRRDVVVVGGGFIGTEFAASAAQGGHKVTILEASDRIMARAVSPELSAWITALHQAHGTRVELGAGVAGIEGDDVVREVVLTNGERIPAGLVLTAIGVVPNTDLAQEAGLEVANGIVVDALLRTSDPDVSGIGDCVNFPSAHAGTRIRLESVQNATDHARHLARVLVSGDDTPYAALPWFWTHQFEANIQMVGIGGAHDERMTSGDVERDAFSIYRFNEEHLVAVESVNAPSDHVAARRLLGSGPKLTRDDILGVGSAVH